MVKWTARIPHHTAHSHAFTNQRASYRSSTYYLVRGQWRPAFPEVPPEMATKQVRGKPPKNRTVGRCTAPVPCTGSVFSPISVRERGTNNKRSCHVTAARSRPRASATVVKSAPRAHRCSAPCAPVPASGTTRAPQRWVTPVVPAGQTRDRIFCGRKPPWRHSWDCFNSRKILFGGATIHRNAVSDLWDDQGVHEREDHSGG